MGTIVYNIYVLREKWTTQVYKMKNIPSMQLQGRSTGHIFSQNS
jgi:hypothetical protein